MTWWFYCMPFIGALAGWAMVWLLLRMLFHPIVPRKIAGITVQGIIPARWPNLAAQAGTLSATLFNIHDLQEKITHPDNVKKIMPQAEMHIDEFLRVKLVKSMPVVGMFVGDKTINNLKTLFVKELEELFPDIMKNYMANMQADLDIATRVRNKLSALPPSSVENAFHTILLKELRWVKILGAVLGFFLGALQLLFVLLVH